MRFRVDLSDSMQWHIFADIDRATMMIIEPYVREGSVILDVGANCGEFTIKIAGLAFQKGFKSVRVYAFEPNPFVVERLSENISLNSHLMGAIKVNQLALADRAGKSHFSFSFKHTGAGRIGEHHGGNVQIEVQIDTIDNYVRSQNIQRVDLIKLDVEGYEGNVLSASMDVLERDRPVFYVEVTDKWLKRNGYSKEYIYDLFEKNQYDVLVVTKNGLVSRALATRLDQQHNVLCVPYEKISTVH